MKDERLGMWLLYCIEFSLLYAKNINILFYNH